MTEISPTRPTRRQFVLATGLSAAGLAAVSGDALAAESSRPTESLINRGDTVLFQGDSITDAGRDKNATDAVNEQPALGNGYAWLAAAELLTDRPEDELKIYNRGISGNKVFQLADRWQADCLALRPDVLSILIGVNDIWHKLNGNYDGTLEKYETDYRTLLERTRRELPSVKLIVCEPFVQRCGAVNDNWFPEFNDYRAAARRVADGAGAVFIPFQQLFDRAVRYAPPEHWAADGVHPTPAGSALMAHAWLKAVGA